MFFFDTLTGTYTCTSDDVGTIDLNLKTKGNTDTDHEVKYVNTQAVYDAGASQPQSVTQEFTKSVSSGGGSITSSYTAVQSCSFILIVNVNGTYKDNSGGRNYKWKYSINGSAVQTNTSSMTQDFYNSDGTKWYGCSDLFIRTGTLAAGDILSIARVSSSGFENAKIKARLWVIQPQTS